MILEHLLLTIEGSLAVGAIVGLLLGILAQRPKIGYLMLLIVPMAMIFFVGWWQAEHPDKLGSTSGLEFIFGPLWPSLGALGGYYFGIWLRKLLAGRG